MKSLTLCHNEAVPFASVHQHTRKLLILLLSVIPFFAQARAQTFIHVPADSGTIQEAINAAHDGDQVLVSAGTYNENLDFKGKAITVTSEATSYQDASAYVLNGMQQGPVVVFQSGETSRAVLNGFTIQNGHADVTAGVTAGGVYITNASPVLSNNVITENYGCGVLAVNHASPTIRGNDIRHNLYPTNVPSGTVDKLCNSPFGGANSGSGIVASRAGTVSVLDNVIEDGTTSTSNSSSGDGSGGGIVALGGDSLTLQGNTIRNNHSGGLSGLYFLAADAASTRLELVNNLFYGNGPADPSLYNRTQVYMFGATQPTNGPPTLTEVNNTIYGGNQELVLFFGPSLLENNIFFQAGVVTPGFDNSSGTGLFCASTQILASPVVLKDNDVYNRGLYIPTQCPTDSSNLTVDPLLVNHDGGNFHLQDTSALLRAGDINAPLIPPTDLDQKARTVCNTIDIGAYEHRPIPPIALFSSANPTPGGGSITFTAKLTGNCNVPTGIVTFLDGSQIIGTGTVDGSGTVTFSTAFLVVGTHNLTASYPGDFNFESSTSALLVEVITGDPTVTTLAVSPNPASAFTPITLSSTVSSRFGTPTGTVVFRAGSAVLATVILDSNGRAGTTITSLGAGTYTITANYMADTRFQPSTSTPIQEIVNGLDSTTSLSATPNPASAGEPATLTASVRGNGTSHTPTGSVVFTDGGVTLGTVALNNGVVSISTGSLTLGSHLLTARYSGSTDFNPSNASLTLPVNLIGTTLTLSSSPNPSNTGQSVTITATLGAGGVARGTITFRDGVDVIGTATLNGTNSAAFSTSTLALGTHSLQASYSGDATHSGSGSNTVSQNVLAYDFAMSVSNDSPSLSSGDWTRLKVTVTPIGGFAGTVQLSCSNLPDHATCGFDSGSTVSLAKGPQAVNVIVNTSDVYEYGHQVASLQSKFGRSLVVVAALLPLFGIRPAKKYVRHGRLLVVLVGGLLLCGLQRCSGKLPASTAPGSYRLAIHGVSNDATQISHDLPINLIVTAPQN